MEQFTNITESKRQAATARQPRTRTGHAHTPLYASPWIALFVVLRREFRQPRPAGN